MAKKSDMISTLFIDSVWTRKGFYPKAFNDFFLVILMVILITKIYII